MDLYVEDGQLNGRSTVKVTGEIDMSNAGELGDFLAGLVDTEQRDLTIDLSGIQFIDSSGLGVLVDIHKQLSQRNRSLTLVSPSQRVTRTLEVSGLDQVLPIDNGSEGEPVPVNAGRRTNLG